MEDPVALRSPAMVRFFSGVMARQMRTSFRAVRLARPGLLDLPGSRPLVVYSNHPSWWDPAFYMVLAPALFPDREGYGPMHADMLRRYGFFRRVGIFGVEPDAREGADQFLRASRRVLEDPRRMLWVAAQGRLVDARVRPLGLRPGVAHLMARAPRAVALPLALEYPFWGEKRPEALACFGAPLDGATGGGAQAWAARLEAALEATCDRLVAASMARDPSAFEPLLDGRRGVGGLYGAWSRLKALARGEQPLLDHVHTEARPPASADRP